MTSAHVLLPSTFCCRKSMWRSQCDFATCASPTFRQAPRHPAPGRCKRACWRAFCLRGYRGDEMAGNTYYMRHRNRRCLRVARTLDCLWLGWRGRGTGLFSQENWVDQCIPSTFNDATIQLVRTRRYTSLTTCCDQQVHPIPEDTCVANERWQDHLLRFVGIWSAHMPISQQGGARMPISQQGGARMPISQQGGARMPISQQGGARMPISQQGGAHMPISQQGGARMPVSQQGGARMPGSQQGGGLNVPKKATTCTPVSDL
eukprot:gene7846-biopygen1540